MLRLFALLTLSLALSAQLSHDVLADAVDVLPDSVVGADSVEPLAVVEQEPASDSPTTAVADESDEASEDDEKSTASAEESDGEENGDDEDADEESADAKSKEEKSDDDKKSKDDAKDDDKDDKEEDKPKPHVVETADLKIETTLDGIFVARTMEEVAVRPEIWSKFKVVESAEHGARVRKGDVIVRFEDSDFEEALAEKSLAQRLDELSMMEAEEELPRFEEAMELAWESAKRERQEYIDEYERFKEVMRPLSEKMAESNLKNAKQSLDNAREELEQLEKMYEADELTEETEEIVLKRQRHMVEYYELYVEYSQVNYDYTMNVSIPRREEMLTMGLKQTELEFQQAKMVKSLGGSKKRYEMEKLREARARSVEQHAKLVADRALLTLRAPSDGIVYYGRCVNGRWTDISSLSSKLAPFGTVSANSVVMTIVEPRPLYIVASVSEKSVAELEKGQEAVISPVADSDVEMNGEIEKLPVVPGASNKFAVELEVDDDEAPEWLMPGMTCKVKVTTYEADDAVVVPADLVQSDDDSDESYVLLLDDDEDEPVRREVEVGRKKDKNVEILEGLEEGDRIVPKKDEE
ncbi:HlyD family efflux transporter periplasmic adaptor subunit [Pirellulales bacterium]|nr:HlyD family efflux transporter periplasmic adaptor subunit [Pirellulales bacterium]